MSSARTFELIEDWYIYIPGYGLCLIPKRFVFDGASVPRFFWWLFSPIGVLFLPGLVHDFMYRFGYLLVVVSGQKAIARKVTRKDADCVFSKLSTYLNDIVTVPAIACAALRLFGFFVWNKNVKRGKHNILKDQEIPVEGTLVLLRGDL